MASEINREEFLGISFSHHMEILHKTKDIHEILFYIHQTVLHKWDKYDLRDCFERNLYAKNGAATNKKKGLSPFLIFVGTTIVIASTGSFEPSI